MTTTTLPTRPQYEYEYRWERIIPALAALVMGGGLLFWGVWALMDDGESEPAAQAVVAETPNTQQVTLPPPVLEKAAPSTPVEPTPVMTAPVETPVIQQARTPAPAAAPAPAAKPAPAARTEIPAKAEPAKNQTSTPPAPANLKPGQISVVDSSAKQVKIQQVLDQEPLPLNKGSISLGEEKAVKVVFSGEAGKPNEFVHYRWYHNGKLVAKVRNQVSPDGMTHSSKFISVDAPGEWQVQMLNKNGKVLAEGAFSAKVR